MTAINIIGLSIGFAAFYILWPYAHSELRTGRTHKDYERIARLTWHHSFAFVFTHNLPYDVNMI